jgi:transitional endoplasmic reticulum ATPase
VFRDARADELVGRPSRPADARRLGELVGELRRARRQRERDQLAARGHPDDRHRRPPVPFTRAATPDGAVDVAGGADAGGVDAGGVDAGGVDMDDHQREESGLA